MGQWTFDGVFELTEQTTSVTSVLNPLELEQLIRRHSAPLVLYARQWTNAAEDCVQEAFIGLAACKTPPDDTTCWLYRVTRNKALNAARGERRRKSREQHVGLVRLMRSTDDAVLDPNETVEELKKLPADQREIIVARIWGGLSFDQIAKLTRSGRSTAHRKYQKALETLRERLGEECVTKDRTN